MNKISEKIADQIPDSWIDFIHEHPRVMYAVSVPLLAFAGWNLMKAARLHVLTEMFVAEHAANAARAASEALGG